MGAERAARPQRGSMPIVRRALAVAVFVALLVLGWRFAGTHRDAVALHYGWGSTEAPLWLALLGAFLLGAAGSGVLLSYELLKQGLLSRRQRRIIERLDAEVHELRNLPLAGAGPVEGPDAATPEAEGAFAARGSPGRAG